MVLSSRLVFESEEVASEVGIEETGVWLAKEDLGGG